mgnify:FL=1
MAHNGSKKNHLKVLPYPLDDESDKEEFRSTEENMTVKKVYECHICKNNYKVHSFLNISCDGVSTYYYTIMKSIIKYNPSQIDGFIGHIAGTIENSYEPWQWIIDFSGFAVLDLLAQRLFSQLLLIIKGNHGLRLQKIVIIRPSWHCNLFLSTIGRNFSKKILTDIMVDQNNMFKSIVDIALEKHAITNNINVY